ncbi:MAG: TonB family protein [Pseudomonadota bacterium]
MTIAFPSSALASNRAEQPGRDVARWTASLAVVLALHALGAAALLAWHSSVEPVPPPLPAIMIDLAPLPVPVPPVVEPPKPPPPEPEKQVIPEPLPSPAPKPEVVLPPPKPKIVHKVTPPPEPKVEPTPVAPTPPQPPQQAIAPPIAAPPSPTATPTYQGLLMAQLERNKRYPRDARMRRQEGVATLRFTLNRDGTLVTFKLERSSGIPALDEEVLAMIQRAAPLPAFPADMPEARLELVVPVRFSLR